MKYIKFGYGRASDHATRILEQVIWIEETAIKMVREYDHASF